MLAYDRQCYPVGAAPLAAGMAGAGIAALPGKRGFRLGLDRGDADRVQRRKTFQRRGTLGMVGVDLQVIREMSGGSE